MKKYLNKILLLLLVYQISTPACLGCSLIFTPIKAFNSKERIFTGVVLGVVGPLETNNSQEKFWGLKIKVDEVVYFPELSTQSIEVFAIGLSASCSDLGVSKENLEQFYPQGTKLKVIAQAAKILPKAPTRETIRLETSSANLTNFSKNVSEEGKSLSDATSYFNYKTYREPEFPEYADKLLPAFELRKDLLRLDKAKSQSERLTILKRLLFFPDDSFVDFEGIARKNINNSVTLRRLLMERERCVKQLRIIQEKFESRFVTKKPNKNK
jgi:hypothetical protein